MPYTRFFVLIPLVLLANYCLSQIDLDTYEKSLKLNHDALLLLKNSEYEGAVYKLNQALKLDSTNRSAYINLNAAYSALGRISDLIPILEKAKSIFLEDDEIYYYAGNAFQRINDIERAIANYDSAILYSKINGEDFELVYAYYFNRGNCFYKIKEYSLAITDFNSSLALRESASAVYANRGNSYYQLNMVSEACADWRMAFNLGEKRVGESIEKNCSD